MIAREIVATLQGREPGEQVLAALEMLLDNDAHLLAVNANERSITHRFGSYLQTQFHDMHVDCEYNRDGIDPKRLMNFGLVSADDTEARTVFPDVIVHRRGRNNANYLVIEFKKDTNPVPLKVDAAKLQGFQADDRLRYRFALLIVLRTGADPGIKLVQWVG